MSNPDRLLALRKHPGGRPLMRQTWEDMAFCHLEADPKEIQSLLPTGLKPDVFDGKSYLGLVAFVMKNVRFQGLPGSMDFLETNVRTYVTDESGNPGVWFFSLDANNRPAVVGARSLYGLPYYRPQIMHREPGRDWMTQRGDFSSRITIPKLPESVEATVPGTIDFWMLERYLLFSRHLGRLWTGRVHHAPYQVARVDGAAEWSGLPTSVSGEPILHYCSGVDVEVFRLQSTP